MQTTPQLLPLQLLLLLAFKCLLAMCHSGLEYKCARSASPHVITLNRRVASVQLNLSIASNGNSSCHALIRGPVRIMTRGRRFNFVYARLIGKLESQQSVLALSSDFGPNGIPVATVTASNQTQFRAFASPSASMYARLSGPSADSVLLDIELVKECPAGWSRHNGACYGAPSADTPAATFREASTGCRHVRSNLAMELETGGMAAGAADATVGGGDGYQSVWIGAAVSGSRTYFLDGAPFIYQRSSDLPEADPPGRCLMYSPTGEFIRGNCSLQLPYLCSCWAGGGGGDTKFYSLDSLDRQLTLAAGSIGDADASAGVSDTWRFPSSAYWFLGVGFGCVCLIGGLLLRDRNRAWWQTCCSRCSHRLCCCCRRHCRRTATHEDNNTNSFVAELDAPVTVSGVPQAAVPPPTYEEICGAGAVYIGHVTAATETGLESTQRDQADDEDEKPPTYHEAINGHFL